MLKSFIKVTPTLLLLTVLALVFSNATAKEKIKFALAGPFSGSYAQYGDMLIAGAEGAAQDINQKGGVIGKEIEIVRYDDACDPKQAVQVANRVVNSGIKFMIGHFCSGATQPAAEIYDEEGVLTITVSTHPDITESGFSHVFRSIGLDTTQAATAAAYIDKHIKPKKIAVLHDKSQYGEGIAALVKDLLSKKNYQIAFYEGINLGEKDYSSIIAKLKKTNVDFVYYGGYHTEMGALIRQSATAGFKPQFMGPETVGSPELSSIGGQASEGVLFTNFIEYDQSPQNAAIAKAMRERKQDPSGTYVFPLYASVVIFAEAIKQANSDEPEKVLAVMKTKTFDTPIGKIKYDSKGNLQDFKFAVYKWHADATKTLMTE